jgi:hypothetical protein
MYLGRVKRTLYDERPFLWEKDQSDRSVSIHNSTLTVAGQPMSIRLVVLTALFISLAFGTEPAVAQVHETATESMPHEEHSAKHEFHRNHFGGVLGTSFHHESDETAPTLGLEYARQFTRHWAISGYVELVSSDLERDIILAAGVIFYPVHWLGFMVAPGVEQATRARPCS